MSNSVLVSDLPKGITAIKLKSYFQRRANGGGTVRDVELRENGEAIVVFEDNETLQTVLQKSHSIQNKNIRVERPHIIENQLIVQAQVELDRSVLQKHGIKIVHLSNMVEEFDGMNIDIEGKKFVITSDSLENLVELQKKCFEKMKKSSAKSPVVQQNSRPSADTLSQPIRQLSMSPIQGNSISIVEDQMDFQSPNLDNHHGYDDSQFESIDTQWSDTPFPQPRDGFTVSQVVEIGGSAVIKRKFGFPAGEIALPGDVIQYESYDCTVTLPSTPAGTSIDEMLKEAFMMKKLFYVWRDIHNSGFSVQSVYNLLPSGNPGTEIKITATKMSEIKSRLTDLGVPVPTMSNKNAKKPDVARQQEVPKALPRLHFPPAEPMDTSPENPNPLPTRPLRFPQPDGLNETSEFHKKDLPGFKGCGSIHMYFRFAGGLVSNDGDFTVQYLSYNRTACLPANEEGRKLYGMLKEAAKTKKLFVVAAKDGTYLIRSKVPLLNSGEYPRENYLQELYQALLVNSVSPLSSVPSLPSNKEAHHGESSDDDEEEKKLEVLKKGGPFKQPDKGMMRLEKDYAKLKGVSGSGMIKIYVRFEGGKMKIEGYKPSKTFEIKYSQVNIVAALPADDNGRKIAAMLQSAFKQKKLFYVERKEGEPSFRVRPHVTLITAEEYPKRGYLANLRRQLQNLGVAEPSENEVANLSIHEPTSPQGGPLPPEWATSSTTTQQETNIKETQFQQRLQSSQRGARPKQPVAAVLPRFKNVSMATAAYSRQRSQDLNAVFASKTNCGIQSRRRTVPKSHRFGDSTGKEVDNNKKEEEKCAICLAELSQQPVKKLPCSHEFHKTCIDMALNAQTEKKCPYCKQSVSGASSQPALSPARNSPVIPAGFSPVIPPARYSPVSNAQGNYSLMNSDFAFGNAFPSNAQHFSPKLHNSVSGSQPPNGVMTSVIDQNPLPGFEGSGTIIIRYNIPSGFQQHCHPNPGQRYDNTSRQAFLPDTPEGQNLLRMLRRAFDAGLIFTVGRSQTTGRDNQIIWNGIPHKTNRRGGRASYGYPDPQYFNELRRALASKGIH